MIFVRACSVTKSYLTLCDPMDCNPPGFSLPGILQQEYWSGLPFPPLGDLPNPGIEPGSPATPALPGGFFTTSPPGKPYMIFKSQQKKDGFKSTDERYHL